jgi:hypothetical protein
MTPGRPEYAVTLHPRIEFATPNKYGIIDSVAGQRVCRITVNELTEFPDAEAGIDGERLQPEEAGCAEVRTRCRSVPFGALDDGGPVR